MAGWNLRRYRLYTYIEMNRFSRGASCILIWCLLAGAGSQAFGQQYPFLPVAGSPKNVLTSVPYRRRIATAP